jgi:hypothetical protein
VGYLEPPPPPAPVIVMKDVGGLVTDYQAQTELYRAQNREVRLHECRSACTLALSLPNVCVYPDSLLKFHQAYNEITKQVDFGVSDELWRSYPETVRARLGTLTRQYKIIRGAELIALGLRDCTQPQQTILVAKAKAVPPPQSAGGTMLSSLESALTSLTGGPPATPVKTTRVSTLPERTPAAEAPLPPLPPSAPGITIEAPLPPPRPPMIGKAPALPPAPALPAYLRPIAGSQRILQPGFVSLAMVR